MNHISVNELPLPPGGKTGWPWTEGSPQLPDSMPDASSWPKFNIVTPSYNQSNYLEETIRSVLLQGYPNLEYIVIDGGSTDGSVEVIKKYEAWLTCWVSEPDRGQSNAINKGFTLTTGEIMAWINSDDFYSPGSLQKVATFFRKEDFGWVAGKFVKIEIDGKTIVCGARPPSTLLPWLIDNYVAQPAVFWKASLWRDEYPLDEGLHYSFDYELWLRFLSHGYAPGWIDQPIANFRYHSQSKSFKNEARFTEESTLIFKRYYAALRLNEKIRFQFLHWKQKKLGELLEFEDTSNNPLPRILKVLRNSLFFTFFKRLFFKPR